MANLFVVALCVCVRACVCQFEAGGTWGIRLYRRNGDCKERGRNNNNRVSLITRHPIHVQYGALRPT